MNSVISMKILILLITAFIASFSYANGTMCNQIVSCFFFIMQDVIPWELILHGLSYLYMLVRKTLIFLYFRMFSLSCGITNRLRDKKYNPFCRKGKIY